MFPLRDRKTLKLMDGVHAGDIGPKLGIYLFFIISKDFGKSIMDF